MKTTPHLAMLYLRPPYGDSPRRYPLWFNAPPLCVNAWNVGAKKFNFTIWFIGDITIVHGDYNQLYNWGGYTGDISS